MTTTRWPSRGMAHRLRLRRDAAVNVPAPSLSFNITINKDPMWRALCPGDRETSSPTSQSPL